MHTTMLLKQQILNEVERLPNDELALYELLCYIKSLLADPEQHWLPTIDLGGRYDSVSIREVVYR